MPAKRTAMPAQRTAMPAQRTAILWHVLAWCCCLGMSAQATRVSDTWRQEYSSITRGEVRQDIALIRMFFTYTGSGPRITETTLKMCSETALAETPTTAVVTVFLWSSQNQEYSVEGALVDDDLCAEFVMPYLVPNSTEPMTYTLVVDQGTLKTSTETFAMTVEVTVLSCGPKYLSRVSWTDPSTKIEEDCLSYDDTLMVCYRDMDLSDQDICFKTGDNEGMVVCRHGGVVVASEPSKFSVNYLAYDPASPDPAHLSLLFNGDSEKSLEVTLWKDSNTPSVHLCDGTCDVPAFVISNSVYEVCAFLKEGILRGPLSGYASVQDLKLGPYDMGQDPLFIEFGFVNSNIDSRKYIASLFTEPPPTQPVATTHLDCVGVAVNHICIGIITSVDLTTSEDTYVSVQYIDVAFENPTNRIAAKVQPLPEVSRNLSSLGDPVYSVMRSQLNSTTDD